MSNGNEPAYPVLHTIDGNWVKEPHRELRGLSKREAFAMAAMQGLLANPNVIWAVRGELHSAKDIQSIANRLADEQLAALDPPK